MTQNGSQLKINNEAENVSFETVNFIDENSVIERSPIDMYWENVKEINRLLNEVDRNKSIGMLMLLGYVSAVESYFRQLFCRIICINPSSRDASINQSLSYGAVLSSKDIPEQLAEALLEKYSFASKEKILDVIKGLLGLKKPTQDLQKLLGDFEDICQLRHCAVHRFGFLGVGNAIKLGFNEHSEKIGNSLKLTTDNLEDICQVCTNTVKVMNVFLFDKILEQTIKDRNIDWKWHLGRDRKVFKKFHNLFYSNYFSRGENFSLKKLYNEFRDKNK